jgi:signal transduction histidine kinase
MEGLSREHLIEKITGLRSSKRNYYSEYREKERRLDRAIASIANISAALCNTTSGVPLLAQAVVRVAAQHFDADLAVIELGNKESQRWIATRNHDGMVTVTACAVPSLLDGVLHKVMTQKRLIITKLAGAPTIVGEPMFLRNQLVGALAVTPGEGFVLDEREISVLQTLANQAAVAFENARLYEESERLRAQATALYKEAYRQKTELEEKNHQLEKARRWLVVAKYNEIINDERNRIARDLHDSVAQYLIGIGMNLEWCRAQLHGFPQVSERINSTKELARSAISRMRKAIFELSMMHGSQSSLIAALSELTVDFEKHSGLHVQLQIRHTPQELAAEVEHALYTIAEEALFNAYKHAQASSVKVELRFNQTKVQLIIIDDGIGIPEQQLDQSAAAALDATTAHFGLRNMRDRAQELGGKFKIARCRNRGTVVSVTAPLHSSNEDAPHE